MIKDINGETCQTESFQIRISQKSRSEPVSRVLSRTIIYLGRQLLAASSNRPGGQRVGQTRDESDDSPSSCLVLLPVGFTEPNRSPDSLVRSYRTVSPLPPEKRTSPIGGLLSVALSLPLRTVGVTHHRVLRSPDFPLPANCRQRPLNSLRPFSFYSDRHSLAVSVLVNLNLLVTKRRLFCHLLPSQVRAYYALLWRESRLLACKRKLSRAKTVTRKGKLL